MGRKDKFTVDYFPHNCNHGKTIFILENRFGNDGYAVWFKTLEIIGASKNHFFDCRNTADWEFMSAKMQVEPERLQQIYDLLASLDAIDKDLWRERIIRSQNFIDNLTDVYSRRSSLCMNKSDLCKHLSIKCKQKPTSSGIDASRNPQTKLNYTKLKKTNVYIAFDEFWNLYDKKVGKPKSEVLWKKLTDVERTLIIDYIPKYKNAQPDKSFRKNPDVFLRNKAWKDEIIVPKPISDGRGVRRTHAPLSDERKKEYENL